MSNQVYADGNNKYFESVRNVQVEIDQDRTVGANPGSSPETVTVNYDAIDNSPSFKIDVNHDIIIKRNGVYTLSASLEVVDNENATGVDVDVGTFFYNFTTQKTYNPMNYRFPQRGVGIGSTNRVINSSTTIYLEAGARLEFRITNFAPSVLKLVKSPNSILTITRVY